MNIYQEIKALVTARNAAEAYGLTVGKNGMTCCPFHDDRHPSMLVKDRFYCFGCGASGDVIDLTARLFNLTPSSAAARLITDFSLPVRMPDLISSDSREAIRIRKDAYTKKLKEKKKKQLELAETSKRRNRMIDRIKSMLSDLQTVKERFHSLSPEEALTSEEFTDAVAMEGKLNHWLDILCFGPEEAQTELIRKEITDDGRLTDPVRKQNTCPVFSR